MPFVLLVRDVDGRERREDLAAIGLPCVIGRDSDLAQIVVVDAMLSRAHCKLSLSSGGLVAEDLSSRNGTLVNGQRITKVALHDGDVLRVGSTQVTIEEVEDESEDPLVGRQVAGFALQEVVGRGRFGTVYRAQQVALGRAVAVKVLSDECRKDPRLVESFLAEARRAGRLNHPNLVQVHDVVQLDDRYLLVMEMMSHCVGEQLREEGPLDEASVLRLLRDIGRALAYAEGQKLVHRDVKPDNILVNEDGVYKLADLGIAMATGADGRAHQERSFGSPYYVAPEQARGGSIDGRADLYALGASAWHLLAGKPLFQGTVREIVAAHLGTPPPDLRRLLPQVTAGTAQLVQRLVEKDPARRPQGAAEVVKTAEGLLVQGGRAAPRPAVPVRRRLRRRRYR